MTFGKNFSTVDGYNARFNQNFPPYVGHVKFVFEEVGMWPIFKQARVDKIKTDNASEREKCSKGIFWSYTVEVEY